MPVARQPVFTPMPPIGKRARHTSLATHRLWRRTACGDAPLVATHRLWRRTACGDAPLVATHRFDFIIWPRPKTVKGVFAAGRRRDRSAPPPRHARAPVFKRLSNALRNGREGPAGENAGQRLLSVRRRFSGACRRAARCPAPREGRAERAGAPICARTAFPVSDGRPRRVRDIRRNCRNRTGRHNR